MTPSPRGRLVLFLLLVCAGVLAACGKKGPPLPPLARVPAAPGTPSAVRVGDEVYVSFTVPASNASGATPADIEAIDLYAFTGSMAPPGPDPTEHAVRVGTYAVVPFLPPPAEGQPAPRSAFVQGATAVVREALTPETRVATPLPVVAGAPPVETPSLAGPLVAPSEATGLKRFYLLIARGPRGRTSPPTSAVAVPLQEPSGPPTGLSAEYSASEMTLRWTAAADARVAPTPPADATLLPSRPLTTPPAATTYHVFEAARGAGPPANPYELALPRPLTEKPVPVTEATIPGPIVFGAERCFVVRAVDTIGGVVAVGRASEPGCVTPRDTFPPAPPQRLEAIAGVGVITLIWEPNTEADLAGYVVLRGAAPGGTLQALTPAPIRETTYRDQTVKPGDRYVYAVVAVDTATPQNVSGQSNRVEESSRAPR